MWPSIPQVSKKLEKIIQNYEQSKDITEFTVNLNKLPQRGSRAENSRLRSSSRHSQSPSPLRGSYYASRSKITPVRQSQSPTKISNKKRKGSFSHTDLKDSAGSILATSKYKVTQINSSIKEEYHRPQSETTTHPPYIEQFKKRSNDEDEPAKPQFEQKQDEQEKKKIADDLMNRSIISQKKVDDQNRVGNQDEIRSNSIKQTKEILEEQRSQTKTILRESATPLAQSVVDQQEVQDDYQNDQNAFPPIEALNSQSSKMHQKPISDKEQNGEANKNNQSAALQDDYSQEFQKSMQKGAEQMSNDQREEPLIDAQFSEIKPLQPGNQEHLQIRASLDLNQDQKQDDHDIMEVTHNQHESMDKNDQPSMLVNNSIENDQSQLNKTIDNLNQDDGQILEITHNQHESMDKNDQPSALIQSPMVEDQSELLQSLVNTKNVIDQANNSVIDESQIVEDQKQVDLPKQQVKKDDKAEDEQLHRQGNGNKEQKAPESHEENLNSSVIKDQASQYYQKSKSQILNQSQVMDQSSQKGQNEEEYYKQEEQQSPQGQVPKQSNDDQANEDLKELQQNREQNESLSFQNNNNQDPKKVQNNDHQYSSSKLLQEQKDKIQGPKLDNNQEYNDTKQGNSIMDQTANSQAPSVTAAARKATERALNSARESIRNEDQIESQMSKVTQLDKAQQIPKAAQVYPQSQVNQSQANKSQIFNQVKKDTSKLINLSYQSQSPSLNASILAKDLTDKALKTAKQSIINQGQIQSQISMMSQAKQQQSKVIFNTEHNDSIRMGQEQTVEGSKFGPNFAVKNQDQSFVGQEPEKDTSSSVNLQKVAAAESQSQN